jgi:hypothetical protein
MPRFCVSRLERDSGIDESVSFHSSTSQCPPIFGPTKRSFSSLTSLAVARSTALNDLPMDDASPARVNSDLAFSAARIFSCVFTRVSTGVSTGFRGVVTCTGANGNVTHTPIDSTCNTGEGRPASKQVCSMRSIPRPQASIWPLRKKALAMSGLNGAEGCLDSNRSPVHSGWHPCRRAAHRTKPRGTSRGRIS